VLLGGDVAAVEEAVEVVAADDAAGAAVVVSAPPPDPQLVSTTARQHAAADRTDRCDFNAHPLLSHRWFAHCGSPHCLYRTALTGAAQPTPDFALDYVTGYRL
jgi:hypothetical protein